MADKRTKPTEFERLVVLGLVLYHVAVQGEKLFRDAEEQRTVSECLAMAFPAEEVVFWRRAAVPEKPYLEAQALADALHSLVLNQFQRQIVSGTIEEDLVPRFVDLYQSELREALGLPAGQGASQWQPAVVRNPTERPLADSPEEDALDAMGPDALATSGGIPELIERLSGEDKEDGHSAEEADHLLAEGWGLFFMHSLRAGLTRAESLAVVAATDALSKGASPHSHRKDPLSAFLQPAEMRAWRRACRKLPCLKVWYLYMDCREERCVDLELKPFCEMHVRLRQAVAQDQKEQAARGERRRYRGGDALLRMAAEQEKAGRADIAVGLRAVDKVRRGQPLSEEEIELAKRAQQWGKEEWRLALLRANPVPALLAPLREDRTLAAGREFALECLRLAIMCWPEGGVPSPDTTADPTSG